MVIFGVFTIYAILSYSTNYLTEMYGMSLVAASYMGIVINKIFRALCGPLGGIITTYSKVKSLPRDPNPFRTRPAGVNCPARHEL